MMPKMTAMITSTSAMMGSDWITRELRRMMLRRMACSCLLELMSCGTRDEFEVMVMRPLLDEKLLEREKEPVS